MKAKIILILGLLIIGGCTAKESWTVYEDKVISFSYPQEYTITKTEDYISGFEKNQQEKIRVGYSPLQNKTATYENLKKGWINTDTDFFEDTIGEKDIMVSIYDKADNQIRFGYIIKHGDYFWGLDYYEDIKSAEKNAQYYLDNKINPEIPKKIIESAKIK